MRSICNNTMIYERCLLLQQKNVLSKGLKVEDVIEMLGH